MLLTNESDDHAQEGFKEQHSKAIDLNKALMQLPELMRLCVVLSYNEGMSHSEIVELTELALGTRSMIVGQVYDTLGGLPDVSPEDQLKLIHRNKTGALLTASCRMGAISAQANDHQLELITQYARAIGLQFQIVDDLLDAEGCAHEVGKATGKDVAAGKMTYPGILGVQQSKAAVQDLADQAANALDMLSKASQGSIEPLSALGEMLMVRKQ